MLNCSIHSILIPPQTGLRKDFSMKDSSLVLRRGQCFRLEINSSVITGSYEVLISFASFFNPTKTYGEYSTCDSTQNARQITLEVKIPNTFPIGKFSLSVKLNIREERETRFCLVSPSLIVLFDPYSYDDRALSYYYREDCGVIFRGTRENPEKYPWEYAQYSEECLEVAMRTISDMNTVEAADVVKVSLNYTSFTSDRTIYCIIQSFNVNLNLSKMMTDAFSRFASIWPVRSTLSISWEYLQNHTLVVFLLVSRLPSGTVPSRPSGDI